MDYSLLLVIEEKSRLQSFVFSEQNWLSQMMSKDFNPKGSFIKSDNMQKSGYKLESACGNYIYHLGIIDYL